MSIDKKRPTKCSAQALGPKEGVVPPCTEHLIGLDGMTHISINSYFCQYRGLWKNKKSAKLADFFVFYFTNSTIFLNTFGWSWAIWESTLRSSSTFFVFRAPMNLL